MRRNNWIALSLLWLFMSYISGISLFSHSHIIDGHAISHSHFYNGTAENPNHSHTAQQYKTIATLSLYITIAATAMAMVSAPTLKLIAVVHNTVKRVIQHQQQLYLLRAPPIFI